MADESDFKHSPLALYLPPSGSAPVIIVCLRENHSLPVTWTKDPVEEGAPITDHARPDSIGVTLDCLASYTPSGGAGYTDAKELWEKINKLQAKPALVDAITIGNWYTNMGVSLVTRPIDVRTANAISFTLTLSGIRIARNRLTRIVVAKDPRAQPNRKAGGVMTFTLDEVDDRTRAAALADGLAGRRFAP